MVRRVSVVLALFFFFFYLPQLVSSEVTEIKPGLWEITTTTKIPGMPIGMGGFTMEQCYTEKDVNDSKGITPKGDNQNNCKTKNYKVSGNKISWTLVCTGETLVTSEGEMTITPTSYSGNMKTTTGGMVMNQTIKGKRIGACK
ncbi:MAG: DUF3617 domain-containing protein [Nitrospinota bacterium]|nr:DUF3617 domain-containing protein [Nitrospinota bacterium]